MGYRISYMLVRTLYRTLQEPSAIALMQGYLSAALRREPKCTDVEVRRFLRDGEIVRLGTPGELRAGGDEAEIRYVRDGREVVLRTSEPTQTLHDLTAEALADGRELEGLEVRRPSLEDVYLALLDEEDEA